MVVDGGGSGGASGDVRIEKLAGSITRSGQGGRWSVGERRPGCLIAQATNHSQAPIVDEKKLEPRSLWLLSCSQFRSSVRKVGKSRRVEQACLRKLVLQYRA